MRKRSLAATESEGSVNRRFEGRNWKARRHEARCAGLTREAAADLVEESTDHFLTSKDEDEDEAEGTVESGERVVG